jgi:hypothetical protein
MGDWFGVPVQVVDAQILFLLYATAVEEGGARRSLFHLIFWEVHKLFQLVQGALPLLVFPL